MQLKKRQKYFRYELGYFLCNFLDRLFKFNLGYVILLAADIFKN